MSHSYLITGGSNQSRRQKALQIIKNLEEKEIKNLKDNPDFIILKEKDSIKINQIRQLKKRLQLKPYQSKFKIALLLEAEKLTIEAQNALLKTLEEPPDNSIIILTTTHPELLLPTIISRCRIIKLSLASQLDHPQEKVQKSLKMIQNILSMGPGKRLKLAETVGENKEAALKFIIEQLHAWRKLLWDKSTSLNVAKIVRTLKIIQKAHRMLKNQVNFKLVIENLLLSYPQTQNTPGVSADFTPGVEKL